MSRNQATRVSIVLRGFFPILFLFFSIFASETELAAVSPGLSIVSGNGQVTAQFFNTTVPLTVQARDANGNPIPNLSLTWGVSQGQGTVVNPPARTDSNGMASAYFNGNVLPGYSFSQQTVTVNSSVGSVNFVVTTAINRLPSGSAAELPLVQLINPPPENRTLTGRSGQTLPGAVAVTVFAQVGPQSGVAIPNVGFRMVDGQDPTVAPVAQCVNQPVTDANGLAKCDLLLNGSPGTYSISADVGEFRITPPIFVTITTSAQCTYSITATSQQFGAVPSIGTLTVNTQTGCSWTASTNASWITLLNPSGTGYGGTGFNVAANSGAARGATITIGGQNIAINQSGGSGSGGGQTLSIVTGPNLPSAVVGASYTASLAASGGAPPYSWSVNAALPGGLTLNPSTGAITGAPSNTGTYSLPVTLRDQAGSTLNQTFTLAVQAGGVPGGNGNGPAITNTGFPSGTAGVAYQQLLRSQGGCAGLFSAAPVYTIGGGTLPPGLSITTDDRSSYIAGTPSTAGTYNFTLTVTDSCNGSGSANFTITVTGTATTPGPVSGSPAALTFSLTTGQSGNPPDQTISLSGPAGATFTVSLATQSGGSWLGLSGQNFGTFPGTVTVHVVNLGNLQPGTYNGMILITSIGSVVSVPIALSVAGPAAALVISPPSINLSATAGGAPFTQLMTVINAAGPARFSILVSTANGGSWLSVNAAAADTPTNLTITLNPTGLQPGAYGGTIQLIPTSPIGNPQVIPVTLRVLPPAGFAIAPVSLTFTNQPGQPPAAPQVLTITSTGVPVDATVAATTVSGGSWLFVTPASGTTPLAVSVAVNPAGLFAGTYQGAIIVASGTQAITPVSIPVTLIIPQTGPVLTAIVNAANYQPGPVSPGEIVTVFGSSIGPATLATSRVNAFGALDAFIGGTRVYFDGLPAPIIYSSTGQVSAIVPYEIANAATTQVEVEYLGVRSAPVTLNVVPSAPALFTFSASGQGPAAAFNEDGTINTASTGAEPGSIVVLYGTGEGQTNPSGVDGLLATSAYPAPRLPVRISFGGQDSDVLYAGAAPNLAAGLLQVNARLPQNLPRGSAIPVVVTIGGVPSQSGVTIFTKQ